MGPVDEVSESADAGAIAAGDIATAVAATRARHHEPKILAVDIPAPRRKCGGGMMSSMTCAPGPGLQDCHPSPRNIIDLGQATIRDRCKVSDWASRLRDRRKRSAGHSQTFLSA